MHRFEPPSIRTPPCLATSARPRPRTHLAEMTETPDAQIRAAINSHAALLGDLGSTATITPSGTRTAMQTVTITVTYQYRTVTPLLSQFGPITLTSQTSVC